jgi:hypothetical protein
MFSDRRCNRFDDILSHADARILWVRLEFVNSEHSQRAARCPNLLRNFVIAMIGHHLAKALPHVSF